MQRGSGTTGIRNALLFRGFPYFAVALIALASVGLLLSVVKPFDPDQACCDHLFYRAQAASWWGLDPAVVTTIPPGSGLDRVYDNYFYDRANGLDAQPPHAYRVAVPWLAGLIGHFTDINQAFYVLNATLLLTIALCLGMATFVLSRSMLAGVVAAFASVWLPSLGPEFAKNYMLVDVGAVAVASIVVLLMATRRWVAAVLVAAVIAPLFRESLASLALAVVIGAFVWGAGQKWFWPMAAVPLLVLVLVRAAIHVKVQAPWGVLYYYEGGLQGIEMFLLALASGLPLVIGLLRQGNRKWLVTSGPVFLFLLVLATSAGVQGNRLWLAYWPFLLVFGLSGLLLDQPRWARFLWPGLVLLSVAAGVIVADAWVARFWMIVPTIAALCLAFLQGFLSLVQGERATLTEGLDAPN